jgi:SAM-dependent methyltransferase
MGTLFELESPARLTPRGEGNCLLCGGGQVEPFLDLGRTPLANRFLTAEQLDQPEPAFPLRTGFCHACGHVQLLDLAPPDQMFTNYLYVSSMSATLRAHLGNLAASIAHRRNLTPDSLVVDIGSNDGTLLSSFTPGQVRRLGIDPAENLAALARGVGVDTLTAYFGAETAARVRAGHGPAAVITATNSFPHIPRLDDYMEGVDRLLAPDGVLVIEAHYLMDFLEQSAFDTIYHEHVSYWRLATAMRLFARHGFEVFDAERLDLHHGQLRMWVRRAGRGPVSPRVDEILEAERRAGLHRLETYRRFAERVEALRHQWRQTIGAMRGEGLTLAGYGAPAKGMTLLSYFGMGARDLLFIADRSPLKQGLYTPGSHIPVVGPERIDEVRPGYLVILAWNFAEEVMAQQAAYRAAGGKFLLPVPELKVI